VCGSHRKILGTEQFCRKDYDGLADDLFRHGARETETYKFDEYVSRFNMVSALIDDPSARHKLPNSRATTSGPSVWRREQKVFSK